MVRRCQLRFGFLLSLKNAICLTPVAPVCYFSNPVTQPFRNSPQPRLRVCKQTRLQNKTLDESLVFWPALLQVCWFRFQLLKQRQKEKTQRVNKTCRVTRRVTHVSQCHKRQHHKTKQRHRNKNLKKTHTKGAEH